MGLQVPYSNTQLGGDGLPSARVSTDAPIEAFGGGAVVSKPEAAIHSLADSSDDIAQRSYIAANTAAKIQTQNEVDTYKSKGLFGTTDGQGNQIPGLIQRVSDAGQHGPAVIDEFLNTYDDTMSKRAASLSNDDQRLAFNNQVADGRRDIQNKIEPVLTSTIQKFAEKQVDDSNINGINWATNNFSNAQEVENTKDKMIAQAQNYGITHGLTDEMITAKVAGPISDMYKNVVEQYYVHGQYDQGTAYFKSIEDQIPDAKVKNQVGKMVQEQQLKGDSLSTAADIVGKYTDENAAMAAVSQIKNPELQSAVRPLVREQIALSAKRTQAADDANVLTALDTVQKSGNVANIKPSVYGQLTPDVRDALQKIQTNQNGSIPIKNNDKVFSQYMAMPPLDLSKVTQAQVVTDVRPNLDDYHFAQFQEQWQNSRQGIGGNQGALNKANDVIKQKDSITQAFSNASIAGSQPGWELQHINSNPRTRVAYNEFEQSVQGQIDSEVQAKGRPLTTPEVSAIANGVAKQNIAVGKPGFFGGQSTKNVSEVVNDPALEVNRVPISNIGAADKQALYQQGVLSGAIPTTMSPNDAYNKYKTNFEKAAGAASKGAQLPEIRAIMGAKYK